MSGRSWVAVLALTAVLIAGLGWSLSRPVPAVRVYDGDLLFQESEAMIYLSELVAKFPRRDYAGPDRLPAADWLAAEFGRLGLTVYTQDFAEVIAGKRVDGLRNVIAILPGELPKALVVAAHYDIPPYVREGAADDGSGVATLLELARVFAQTTPRWTMVFLASDSEEYGAMWGSYSFLGGSGWRDRVAAVVSLDYANMGPMAGIKLRNMGIHQGYTPLWLREMAKRSIAPETLPVDVDPVMEWVERAVTVAPTEHGVYLEAGIPAVDLWGQPKDTRFQNRFYHTAGDTLEKIEPATILRYGRSAERLLRSLQALPDLPHGEMRYLKLGSRYLPGWAVLLLQTLALFPLALGAVSAWIRALGRGRERRSATLREAWVEMRALAALFAAGALGYLALWLSSETGLMIKYELYPATQKDPALGHPQLLPLLVILGALVCGFYLFRWLFRASQATSPGVRRAVALTLLLLLVLVSVFTNGGFAALAFLAPAIYLWPLAKDRRGTAGRAVNLALALSALVVFVAFVVLFSKLYFIGQAWWYILMAAAYGLFRARVVLAFLLSLALFVRFTSAAVARPEP